MADELSKSEVDILKAVSNALELSLRTYSGRGMYGKECVAVDSREGDIDRVEFVMEVAEYNKKLAKKLRGPSSDNMGRGQVVYWPSLQLPKGWNS